MKPDVVVDIGNTRMKWGRCHDGRLVDMRSLLFDAADYWERQASYWQLAPHSSWAVATVHPERLLQFANWLLPRGYSMIELDQKSIPLDVEGPDAERVGLDRLLNAVAVKERVGAGSAAVIVDAGSAVTVDYLDELGRFRGGAIFPGLGLMAKALHDYTAKLPLVHVHERRRPPGTSTTTAIQLGVFSAVLGGIELVVRELSEEAKQVLPVYFGGGDAGLLGPHLAAPVTIWPEMTLIGILATLHPS